MQIINILNSHYEMQNLWDKILVYTGGGEDGKPFLIGLIDIKQLKKKAKEAGIID